MSDLLNKVSGHLATSTSRRGFLATAGKLTLGVGAAAAGVKGITGASASGTCCTNICNYSPQGYNVCTGSGYCYGNNPFCCHNQDGYYACYPCVFCNGACGCSNPVTVCYTFAGPFPSCTYAPAA